MSNETTVITGASGLLGQAFIDHYQSSNQKYLALTRGSSTGKNQISVDYSNQNELPFEKEHKITRIIHCAGRPAIFASMRDPVRDHLDNFNPLLFSLELARRTKAHLILISSPEVFGSTRIQSEDQKYQAESFYALNKEFSEKYLRLYAAQFDFNYNILRPSVIFGDGLKKNVLFDLAQAASQKKDKIGIFCRPKSLINLVHCEDVVDATEFVCDKELWNQDFNIGSPRNIMVQELIAYFEKAEGKSFEIEILEDNLHKREVSVAKLAAAGWKPKQDLFERVGQWYEQYKRSALHS